jgi:hypothetical protein
MTPISIIRGPGGIARLAVLAMALSSAPAAAQQAEGEPAPAVAASCPTQPVSTLSVVVDVADYVYDHSRSVAELGHIERGSATTSGHDVKRMLGLTRQGFNITIDTARAMTMPRSDGGLCVGFTDGTIRMHLTTEIYLVRELPRGSCLYNEVLNHEQRHANVGKRLFTQLGGHIEAALAGAIKSRPFIPIDSREAAGPAALAMLQEIVGPYYKDFQSTYRKRQAIIDTSGEYARVAAACPGEQQRVLRQQ